MKARRAQTVGVSPASVLRILGQITGCERCREDADIPLAWVVDGVLGLPPSGTRHRLPDRIACPNCRSEITEETLVEWD